MTSRADPQEDAILKPADLSELEHQVHEAELEADL